jgi:uncharacterized protein YjbJ (UPF0337 family)
MNKDRIDGQVSQIKGVVKDAAGKITGDVRLQAEGKKDKAEGKVQSAVGRARDALKK